MILQKQQGERNEKRIVEHVDSITSHQSRSGMLNHTGGTYSHDSMMDCPRIPSRNGILENFLTPWNLKAGKSPSELRFVYEQPILRSPCSGTKKLRLPNQLPNL